MLEFDPKRWNVGIEVGYGKTKRRLVALGSSLPDLQHTVFKRKKTRHETMTDEKTRHETLT